MNISNIVCNLVNKIKSKTISASLISGSVIKVKFYLTLPKWANDEDIIGDRNNYSILYSKLNKNFKNFIVNKDNKDQKYPQTGKLKFLVINREYDLKNYFDKDIVFFLKEERRKALQEIKSNLALEENGKK